MVIIMGLVLLAVLLIAVLQYRWADQVSASERDRMQASLHAGAARFSEDFDRELARAYLTFQMDADTFRSSAWGRYTQRYDAWQTDAPYPHLIDTVYLVEVYNGGRLRLMRYDPAARQFAASAWPLALQSVPQRFNVAYQSADGHATLDPIIDDVPALLIPVSRIWMLSDQQQSGINADLIYGDALVPQNQRGCWQCPKGETNTSLSAYTIVTLNTAYLTDTFIPMLAHRYFASGNTLDYQLVITSQHTPDHVIYRSVSAVSAPARAASDETVTILNLRIDELSQLLLNNAMRQTAANPDDANERMAIGILGRDTNIDGHWQVTLTHRDGSLEAAVANVRLRNLLLSFGTLLLLLVSVLMIIIAMQRTQRLAQQQIELVAGVSHELRTPLTVICAASENLTDGVVRSPQQAQRYGALILDEGRRLTALVEQALELAGTQSGQQLYDVQPADVAGLVAAAITASQSVLAKGGAIVNVQIAPDLPPVLVDAAALQRSIHNLLSNALKYGGTPPRISVEVQRGPSTRAPEIAITVRDNGNGIAPADLPHIFAPFYRGQAALCSTAHGSGLGLSLVQRTMLAHSGRVSVASTPEHGSAFTLHLPSLCVGETEHTQAPRRLLRWRWRTRRGPA